MTVNVSPAPLPEPEAWEDKEGAPHFREDGASTAGDPPRIDARFRQENTAEIGEVRARMRGAGSDTEWTTPRHMRGQWLVADVSADVGAQTDPEIPEGHIAMEVSFWWKGAQRHAMWLFKIGSHPKGFEVKRHASPDQCWTV